ncbi:MAG: glucose-6-phosphate isomerase [Pseudomonadota bacterium]
MAQIKQTEAWKAVAKSAERLRAKRAIDLFSDDPKRAQDFSIEAAGLFLDYSKNKIDHNARALLLELASERDLIGAIKSMVSGEKINNTEDRAVLHIALRDFALRSYFVGDEDAGQAARAEREKQKRFANRFANGELRGFTGEVIDTAVNIGIGGSDLGPHMASEALRPYWLPGRKVHFVSNVDGQHLDDTLRDLDPARTLFLIASKTFTTQETMTNAHSARDWLCAAGADEAAVAKHFIALSSNERAVVDFGIEPQNMFVFWNWVGGRYSLWSAIGLSIALQTGWDVYERLLRGAHLMDEHFRDAPLGQNMPVLLALVGVWNRNFMGCAAHAVLPYDQHLHRLPAYLQQADMESNGKSVMKDGRPASYGTGPVIFGEPGTNGQHAFYQLIHQGTDVISSDFIAAAQSASPLEDHHEKLLANFLAQPEALMRGKPFLEAFKELEAEGHPVNIVEMLTPHKVFPGDRPTNSIIFDCLSPERLGALIALYEHKIFCQGVIWQINSFDQWGVELGKALAKKILPQISAMGEERPAVTDHDPSTNQLIDRLNAFRARGGSTP